MKTKRFEARLDPALDKDLTELARDLDIDKSELARRAFSLYLVAKKRERENGETISMSNREGQQTVALVGV
jgi:post-segregation antitoxin (ccd killing protein)